MYLSWSKFHITRISECDLYNDVYHTKGHTEVDIHISLRFQKYNLKMPWFFQMLKNFTMGASLATPGGSILLFDFNKLYT